MTVTFTPPGGSETARRRSLGLAVAAAAGLVALGVFAILTRPGPESGELYFTTFRNQALYKADFSFSNGRPHFGAQHLVARLPRADGVTFESNGKALVGGQFSGNVEEVDPATGNVRQVPSGCPDAYLLALAPSGTTVYTAGIPGDLCAMPTNPLRPGHMIPLKGDDTQITDLAFDQTGQAFYTTGISAGPGNFGLIDLATGTTSRQLSGIVPGHGMAFDPYTKTLFLFGGDAIYQVDPLHPKTVLSTMTVPGVQFDNGTTDGKGHLYVASNFGQLVVVDYSVSGRIGDTRNTVTTVNLHANLDDVAPLVGPGVAPGSRRWIGWTASALGALLVLALIYRFAPRPRLTSQLPSWDLRRQETEARHRVARRRRAQQQEEKRQGQGRGQGGARSRGRPERPPSRGR